MPAEDSEANVLFNGDGCGDVSELVDKALRDVCAAPVCDGAETFSAVVEWVGYDDRRLLAHLEEAFLDCRGNPWIHGRYGVHPLEHVESSEFVPTGNAGLMSYGLSVYNEATWREGWANVAQGVHDALNWDASQWPAAKSYVESLARGF